MEKVIEFLSQPFVLEILKGLIGLNFGVLIGIFYSDWKQERRAKREERNVAVKQSEE